MESSSITSKGQIILPPGIRKVLGVDAGDIIEFVIDGDRVVLVRGEKDIVAAFGLVKVVNSVSVDEIKATVLQRTRKKLK